VEIDALQKVYQTVKIIDPFVLLVNSELHENDICMLYNVCKIYCIVGDDRMTYV